MNINASRFSNLPPHKNDGIFSLVEKYKACYIPNKMNLTIGTLQDEEGNLLELKSLKLAEKAINDAHLNKEYPIIFGMPEYKSSMQNLFFPNNHDAVKEERILIIQSINGGAALKVGSETICKFLRYKKIHVSNLTWSPYYNIFSNLEILEYPYYNKEEKRVDVDGFLEYLNQIESCSNINFQLSSHNPTALDFSKEDWDKISKVMKTKEHIAFFDVAYLGFGNGSFEEDLYPIHMFADNKIEMLIAYSCGKNFTLYSDDSGALILVLNKKETLNLVKNYIIGFHRGLFSFSGIYGSRIVAKILSDTQLRELWVQEMNTIWKRLADLRNNIINEISNQKVNIRLDFLKRQKGIYIFLDLTDNQVNRLADEFGIFLCLRGRVNLSSITKININYFVKCLKTVLEE